MKKYYLMAIALNNVGAMNNLGSYYQLVEKNDELMKKYYLMAIALNNVEAMNNLGYYYQYIEKNDELMKKYYLMAIEHKNAGAMNNLGYYYMHVEKNYQLMEKYYLMAIDLNNEAAMNNLGYYYQCVEKKYDLMKKYYLMAINHNDSGALDDYCHYFMTQHRPTKAHKLYIKTHHLISRERLIDNIAQLWVGQITKKDQQFLLDFLLSFEFNSDDTIPSSLRQFATLIKNRINIMEAHFKYSMIGPGFKEAKEDFVNRITN
jgi:uncharacterized protein YcgL (UPF0745 family)